MSRGVGIVVGVGISSFFPLPSSIIKLFHLPSAIIHLTSRSTSYIKHLLLHHPSSIKHQTSSDCTGGHKVMQFDTASQNNRDETKEGGNK